METDYSTFMLWLLDKLDLKYDYIEREDKGDYILSQHILGSDEHASLQLFVDNGFCLSHNSMIDGKNRVHIRELAKQVGHGKEYVEWLLQEHNVSNPHLNNYKDLIIKKSLKEKYDFKKYKKLVDIFGKLYISQSYILGIDEVRKVSVDKFNSKVKKKKKSSMTEIEMSQEEYQKCKEYIEGRMLSIQEGRVEPTKLQFSSGYSIIGIALRYSDGFCKYRLLSDSFRYCSKGTYSQLFEIRNNNTLTCIITEGEIEGLSLQNCVEYDLYSFHNCNSITNNGISQLESYDKIIMFIDNDKWNEVKDSLINQVKSIYPNKEVLCLAKFDSNDKKLDFNKTLIKKELKGYINKILTEI